MEATLDKLGRIVIPKQLRDDLGLSAGAVLSVEGVENGIVLKPVEERDALILEDGVLVFAGAVDGDIEAAVTRGREGRARKLAGLD